MDGTYTFTARYGATYNIKIGAEGNAGTTFSDIITVTTPCMYITIVAFNCRLTTIAIAIVISLNIDIALIIAFHLVITLITLYCR